ncbi:MAG TPA: arabinofuranosyltransferase, partial [Ardenticatenaceae bacterium]|nr:arabinofuranosyltransferase [Ardenticatenaceae bacterium]
RYGLLMTAFLVPFVTWWFWRRLVDPFVALSIVFSALLFQDWYKNAEWLVLILFVPWWLYWVEDVRDRRPLGWRAQLRWFVTGGLIGTIIFQTYYYWFFQGGVSLVLNVAGSRLFVRDNPWTLQRVRAAVVMLASVALFSVVYWGPYLASMVATGGWTPMQARWLREGLVRLPLPIADGSPHGWLFAVGLAYLIWSARRDRVARGLLGLLLGVYGWLILGYVGILTGRPLLTFKAYPVVEYLLAIAASLALGKVWSQRPYPGWLKAYAASAHRFVSVALVVLLLFFSQYLVMDYVDESSVELARDMEYPRDRLAAFDMLTEGQYSGKVVLASTDDLVVFRPVYMFQPLNVLFSHPAGLFERRTDFLEALAVTSDPRLFAAAWMNNRYSPIDYVMLDWDGAAWRAEFWEDNFPDKTRPISIAFSPAAFASAYFQGEHLDGYTLFSTRFAADPLAAIRRDALSSASPETLVLLYALATSFGDHVVLPDAEALRVDLEQRLARTDLAALPVESLLDLQLATRGSLQDATQAQLLAQLPNNLEINLMDESGRPKLQLLSSEIQLSGNGETGTQLAIYFKVLDRFPSPEPGEQDYRIWVRAAGPAEHQGEERSLVRPARWEPGKIYRHVHPLPLAPGDYQFAVGFRRGETGLSLTLPSGGWQVDLGSHQVP